MPQNEYERAYEAGNSHLRPTFEPTQFDNADQRRGYEQGKANREYWQNVATGNRGGGEPLTVEVSPGCVAVVAVALTLPAWVTAWAVLYPLPAAAAAAGGMATYGLVAQFAPADAGTATPLHVAAAPWAVGLVVAVVLGRLDHRLALYRAYQVPRQVVRVILAAFVGLYVGWATSPGPKPKSVPLDEVVSYATTREQLFAAAAALLAVVLLRWGWLQRAWHRVLEAVRLRPARLPGRRR